VAAELSGDQPQATVSFGYTYTPFSGSPVSTVQEPVRVHLPGSYSSNYVTVRVGRYAFHILVTDTGGSTTLLQAAVTVYEGSDSRPCWTVFTEDWH
jgi:hypothetical protein